MGVGVSVFSGIICEQKCFDHYPGEFEVIR